MLDWVRDVTGARAATDPEHVQSLWGGYGEILRVHLTGAEVPSVIVKRVEPAAGTGRSHERKLRSYAVEQRWYEAWSPRCGDGCRVPRAYAAESTASGWRFVLEDLDASGFAGRRGAVTRAERDRCLAWLADFHATFLGDAPDGLWETGSYWHLATRPDELARIEDPALRDAAGRIDAALANASYRTLVHGDPKLANFCFAPGASAVAAVDFQYVGGGVGVRDVAYLLFSAAGWHRRVTDAGDALDVYFAHLSDALARLRPNTDADAVEREWRRLYPVAAADFHRFLAGWSPSRAAVQDYRASLPDDVV